MPVWNPDHVVSPELAAELIGHAFPELLPVKVREFGEGWDNTVYLVNESIVFRFPRRRIAAPLMQIEIDLLPWLAPQLPVAIPEPRHVGSASDRYSWRFAGYPLIAGHPIYAEPLTENQRAALAKPLALFLKTLHAIPVAMARDRGVPEDQISRLDVERRRRGMNHRLDTLVQRDQLPGSSLRGRLNTVLDAVPDSFRPRSDTLVHGDLHSSQILLDDQGQLAGIIDWGDVHIGDRANDFAVVHASLPPRSHPEFLEAYGEVEETTWKVARARAAWLTVAILAHAADTKHALKTADAQSSLDRLLAGLPG